VSTGGVDVAVGDLGVPATIDAAMRGVLAVVLVSPALPAQELKRGHQRRGSGRRLRREDHQQASADSPIARRRDQTEIENGLIASGLVTDYAAAFS